MQQQVLSSGVLMGGSGLHVLKGYVGSNNIMLPLLEPGGSRDKVQEGHGSGS